MQAGESAAQLFSRLGSCEIQGGGILLFNDHLKPGADVVQLCGEENCGKTEVLLNIIADTILPDQWNEIRLPGRNLAVIFISTDHKFDLLRLVCIMENKLRNCIEKQKFKNSKRLPSIEEQKSLVISSLERCHVFKTSSHDELFSTVNWLGTFLQQVMNVCVIAIDNIAAYYWIERSKQGPIEFESSQKSMVNSLRKLQHHHSVVLYFTTPSLMAGNSDVDPSSYLPRCWRQFTTHHYVLHPAITSPPPSTDCVTNNNMFVAIRIPHKSLHHFCITDSGLTAS